MVAACANAADPVKPYKNMSKWRMHEFMISTWGAPTDEASTKLFAETGFNVVMAGPIMLDLLQKYHMKTIAMYVTPEMVAKIKNHPAVWGYYVRDEPWNQADYDKVAAEAEAIRKVDRTHPCYVNLGGAMEGHPTFMNTIKPDFLSFDFYQWWWRNTFGLHHFSRLESYRRAALDADLPLLCWVETSSDPRYEWGLAGATRLPDNPEKLRHSVYTNIAYGVKGIQWFTAGLAFYTAPDGKLTRNQAGDDIALLNTELKALGPILIKLTSTDVFHTSPVPATCRMLPLSFWVTTKNDNVVIGVFKDKDNRDYLLVVNRDWQNANNIKLSFDPSITGVEAFNRDSRKWKSVLKSSEANFNLTMGDGVLLRVKR
jgi:hypothetical protein